MVGVRCHRPLESGECGFSVAALPGNQAKLHQGSDGCGLNRQCVLAELLCLIEAAELAQLGDRLELEIHAIGMRGRCRSESFECRGSVTALSRDMSELGQGVGVMRIYRQGVPA